MSSPTIDQVNALTDHLFFLAYTGGQPVRLTAGDPRIHDWYLTRHFVWNHYDALVADPDGTAADFVASVWNIPSNVGTQRAQLDPQALAQANAQHGVMVQGSPSVTNDELRRQALDFVMRHRVDHPSERMWAVAFVGDRATGQVLPTIPPVFAVPDLFTATKGIDNAASSSLSPMAFLRYGAVFELGSDGSLSLAAEQAPDIGLPAPEVQYNPQNQERIAGMTHNPTGIISGHRGYGGAFRLPYRDRLAYIAPIVYPAAAGAGINFAIDGNLLRASICVDGRCYDGSYDLTPILARYGASSANEPSDPGVAYTAAMDVQAAGEVLVAGLIHEHADTMISGWWDDITHAVTGAAKSIGGGVMTTLRTLKEPLKKAAAAAAPQLVAAIPGVGPEIAPFAGPMAGQVADNLIDAALGDDKAKQNVAQIKQAAKTDPAVAAALSAAQKATAKSVAAYHGAQTAANAASGNVDAQAQIRELMQAAQSGSPSAASLFGMISSFVPGGIPGMGAGSAPAPSSDGSVAPSDGTAVDMAVSGVSGMGRQAASALAVTEHQRSGAPAIGVVFQGNGAHIALPLESLDAADDWLGRLEGGTFTYAAYFDPSDPTWPAPINERVGAKVVSSGWLAPILAAAGGFGLGAVGWPYVRDTAARFFHRGDGAGAPPVATTPPTR